MAESIRNKLKRCYTQHRYRQTKLDSNGDQQISQNNSTLNAGLQFQDERLYQLTNSKEQGNNQKFNLFLSRPAETFCVPNGVNFYNFGQNKSQIEIIDAPVGLLNENDKNSQQLSLNEKKFHSQEILQIQNNNSQHEFAENENYKTIPQDMIEIQHKQQILQMQLHQLQLYQFSQEEEQSQLEQQQIQQKSCQLKISQQLLPYQQQQQQQQQQAQFSQQQEFQIQLKTRSSVLNSQRDSKYSSSPSQNSQKKQKSSLENNRQQQNSENKRQSQLSQDQQQEFLSLIPFKNNKKMSSTSNISHKYLDTQASNLSSSQMYINPPHYLSISKGNKSNVHSPNRKKIIPSSLSKRPTLQNGVLQNSTQVQNLFNLQLSANQQNLSQLLITNSVNTEGDEETHPSQLLTSAITCNGSQANIKFQDKNQVSNSRQINSSRDQGISLYYTQDSEQSTQRMPPQNYYKRPKRKEDDGGEQMNKNFASTDYFQKRQQQQQLDQQKSTQLFQQQFNPQSFKSAIQNSRPQVASTNTINAQILTKAQRSSSEQGYTSLNKQQQQQQQYQQQFQQQQFQQQQQQSTSTQMSKNVFKNLLLTQNDHQISSSQLQNRKKSFKQEGGMRSSLIQYSREQSESPEPKGSQKTSLINQPRRSLPESFIYLKSQESTSQKMYKSKQILQERFNQQFQDDLQAMQEKIQEQQNQMMLQTSRTIFQGIHKTTSIKTSKKTPSKKDHQISNQSLFSPSITIFLEGQKIPFDQVKEAKIAAQDKNSQLQLQIQERRPSSSIKNPFKQAQVQKQPQSKSRVQTVNGLLSMEEKIAEKQEEIVFSNDFLRKIMQSQPVLDKQAV